ncbi:hypothetical protein BBJ28_00000118 [Nothophytophthora sp. Chile5]|nr:hypothetical protein BBJ28_00000118 [Nothophytophthora sp. Chile5]
MGPYMSCTYNAIFAAPDDKRPHNFSRSQILIVNKYLPSFRYQTTSTEGHRMAAAAFWNEAFFEVAAGSNNSNSRRSNNASQGSSRITQLYDTFYSFLDHNSPALKPIFRSSMVVRSKVLVHISAGMRTILVGENIGERVQALIHTHMRFGVKMDMYDPLGNALMHAMKECSGPLWTPAVEDAWRRLYAHCCVILLESHKRSMDHRAKEAHEETKLGGNSPQLQDIYSNMHPRSIKENSIAPASTADSARTAD